MTDSTPVRRVRLRSGLTEIGAPMGETIPTYQDYVLGEDFDRLQAENVRLAEQRDALQRFKDFVHRRLTTAGIPTHPDGPHSKEGCRVGDRLDHVIEERDSLRAQLDDRDARIGGLEVALEAGIALLENEGCEYDDVRTYLEMARAALAKGEANE